MDTAYDLISRSIGNDCIAHAGYDGKIEDDLLEDCDDYAINGDTSEFWGERDGEPWRVHLDH